METKQLGTGARTDRYRGHDRHQWENFQRLPNLLYADGAEFALYRSGELVDLGAGHQAIAHLPVDPETPAGAPDDITIDSFLSLVDAFIATGAAQILIPIPSTEESCPDSVEYDAEAELIRLEDGAVGAREP